MLLTPTAAPAVTLDETPRGADGTPLKLATATFALGCFWGSDALFGTLPGVYRSRPGYTGGTKLNPTYHDLGDHTESVEVDYNPQQTSYADLLKLYFDAGGATSPPYSRQYRYVVFFRSPEERSAAEAALAKQVQTSGRALYIAIEPAGKFYRAEDYHHKYGLRGDRELMRDMSRLFPHAEDFEDSTLAMRLNTLEAGGMLDEAIYQALPLDRLSPAGQKRVEMLKHNATRRIIHCG